MEHFDLQKFYQTIRLPVSSTAGPTISTLTPGTKEIPSPPGYIQQDYHAYRARRWSWLSLFIALLLAFYRSLDWARTTKEDAVALPKNQGDTHHALVSTLKPLEVAKLGTLELVYELPSLVHPVELLSPAVVKHGELE